MTTNAQTPVKLYYEDVQVGDTMPELVKPALSHIQLVRYAGASGDFNPLHTDPKFGEMVGTGGIIAHGMLIMGFVGQLLSDYVGPAALRKFGVRFRDRKSTRLNSSHQIISYAVFCLKKKKTPNCPRRIPE